MTGSRIAIPSEAATSSLLLKVVLTLKYRVQAAAYVTLAEAHDAFLLMGSEGSAHTLAGRLLWKSLARSFAVAARARSPIST